MIPDKRRSDEQTLTIVLKPNQPHAQVFVDGEQVGFISDLSLTMSMTSPRVLNINIPTLPAGSPEGALNEQGYFQDLVRPFAGTVER